MSDERGDSERTPEDQPAEDQTVEDQAADSLTEESVEMPVSRRARAEAARADRTPGKVTDEKKSAKAAKKDKKKTASSDSLTAADEEEVPVYQPPASEDKASREFSVTLSAGLIGKILAGLLTVALLVLVIVGGVFLRDKQQRLDAFEESKQASITFIETFVETANADSADQYKERLGPLSTGEFREKLEQQRSDTEEQVRDMQISASGDVKLTTVENFTSDTATTSVLVEVTATGAALPTPQRATMIYVLTLFKEDGEWLVAKLEPAPGTAVVYGGEDSVLQPNPNDAAPAPEPQPGG